jgi:hypothetical protein
MGTAYQKVQFCCNSTKVLSTLFSPGLNQTFRLDISLREEIELWSLLIVLKGGTNMEIACNLFSHWKAWLFAIVSTAGILMYLQGWFWGLFPWDRNPDFWEDLKDKTEIGHDSYDGSEIDNYTGRP